MRVKRLDAEQRRAALVGRTWLRFLLRAARYRLLLRHVRRAGEGRRPCSRISEPNEQASPYCFVVVVETGRSLRDKLDYTLLRATAGRELRSRGFFYERTDICISS